MANESGVAGMRIAFFCQGCGSRFEVDEKAAGKTGRCNKCGQRTTVPKGESELRKTVAPALAVAGAGPVQQPPAGSNWLANMASSVGLAPLTSDRLVPIGTKRKRSPLDDDLGDGKPYELAKPERVPGVSPGQSSKPAGRVTILWRHQLRMLERLFRWLNQTAYLLSVPFIMLLLFGAVTRNQHLAVVGATIVVVLNIGRLISGFANVAVVPFRDGIDWKRLKKPIGRLIEPVFTIGLVAAAFVFLPGLSGKPVDHRGPGFLQKLDQRLQDASSAEKERGANSSGKINMP
jgi:hypothetical protein